MPWPLLILTLDWVSWVCSLIGLSIVTECCWLWVCARVGQFLIKCLYSPHKWHLSSNPSIYAFLASKWNTFRTNHAIYWMKVVANSTSWKGKGFPIRSAWWHTTLSRPCSITTSLVSSLAWLSIPAWRSPPDRKAVPFFITLCLGFPTASLGKKRYV
jgi:hypothetical protein